VWAASLARQLGWSRRLEHQDPFVHICGPLVCFCFLNFCLHLWGVFPVRILMVCIFYASFGKTSGLVAGVPYLPTIPVFKQVAALTVPPPRGKLSTILASNPHSCRVDVALGIVTPVEKIVTDGATKPPTLLLYGLSSCTRRSDQQT